MHNEKANYEIMNLGSGIATTINDVASTIGEVLDVEVQPEVTGQFRKGDVRHCYAEMSKTQTILDYSHKVSFKEGIEKLVEWAQTEESVDKFDKAQDELKSKGLL